MGEVCSVMGEVCSVMGEMCSVMGEMCSVMGEVSISSVLQCQQGCCHSVDVFADTW